MFVVYGVYIWNEHVFLCWIALLIKVQLQMMNNIQNILKFNIYNMQTFYRKPVT